MDSHDEVAIQSPGPSLGSWKAQNLTDDHECCHVEPMYPTFDNIVLPQSPVYQVLAIQVQGYLTIPEAYVAQ
jgi:hypothetical protein